MHWNIFRKILNLKFLLFLLFFPSIVFSDNFFSAVRTDMLNNNSTYLEWHTPKPASGYLEYGEDTNYGNLINDGYLAWWHYVKLDNLAPNTIYHYRVRAIDYLGNEDISQDYQFTTLSDEELNNRIRTARQDGGLPVTYYVTPAGNNSNNGLSLDTAWATVSYGIKKLDVGDTLYVSEGIYDETDSGSNFYYQGHAGIPEAPVKILAYEGTPVINFTRDSNSTVFCLADYTIWDGVNLKGNAVQLGASSGPEHGFRILGTHVFLRNFEIHDYKGAEINIRGDYCICENITMDGAYYNSWDLIPSREHVMLKNSTLKNNPFHGLINYGGDSYWVGGVRWFNIVNNNLINTTSFSGNNAINDNLASYAEYVAVVGNRIENLRIAGQITGDAIAGMPRDPNGRFVYFIYNNTLKDIGQFINYQHMEAIVSSNTISNCTNTLVWAVDSNLTLDNNYDESSQDIYTRGGHTEIIDHLTAAQKYWTETDNGGSTTIKYSDGRVFSAGGAPVYSPAGSEILLSSWKEVAVYKMTVLPSSGSATVIVNKFDPTLIKGNILVDFTVDTTNGNNVDFVVGDLKADTNYEVTRAGISYHIVKANANKCIKFSNSEWSAKAFTIEETGLAPDIITDPSVNIDSDTSSPITTPSAPQSLSATAGDGEVNLSWQAPSSDGGSAITDYKVYRSNSSGGKTLLATAGTSLSYSDTAVSSGLTCYYQISAVNSVGESPKSNEVIAMPTASTEVYSKIKVYPNPYIKGKSSASKITFANLPGEATIRIYSSNGKLVKELSIGSEGKAEWDVTGVNSGVYLYVVNSAEGVKKGKVSVIK